MLDDAVALPAMDLEGDHRAPVAEPVVVVDEAYVAVLDRAADRDAALALGQPVDEPEDRPKPSGMSGLC